jgi:ATP phosphoribosyltransferase regulatory subunit
LSSREPVQVGCELFGHQGLEADLEVQELALASLDVAGLAKVRLDLSHRGIFLALRDSDSSLAMIETEALAALQSKDRPRLEALIGCLKPDTGRALLALLDLYGPATGPDNVIDRARSSLPKLSAIGAALDRLAAVAQSALFTEHPQCVLTVDLADLRGYRYHNGVLFSIYCDGLPNAVVRGGRYDGVGEVFGRSRPATGFSLEMRELLAITDTQSKNSPPPIAAPWLDDAALRAAISELRASGQRVIRIPDAELGVWKGQKLVNESGRWQLR